LLELNDLPIINDENSKAARSALNARPGRFQVKPNQQTLPGYVCPAIASGSAVPVELFP
jgi:hypothetical protein